MVQVFHIQVLSHLIILGKDEVIETNDKMIPKEIDSARSSSIGSQEDCSTIGKYFQGGF